MGNCYIVRKTGGLSDTPTPTSLLPSEYTQLSYIICSSDTQATGFGFVDRYYATIMYPGFVIKSVIKPFNTERNYQYLFGNDTGYKFGLSTFFDTIGDCHYDSYYNTSLLGINESLNYDTVYTKMSCENYGVNIGYIDSSNKFFYGKIYNIHFAELSYDESYNNFRINTIVNFIPAKRNSDNAIGMYALGDAEIGSGGLINQFYTSTTGLDFTSDE